ncbi:uncharacterized protein LOC128559962 [Mercenaria mercenaria]|uniref:uncharacterized protein LOC128559962 n=1 Tax=Mercenaria mercenaria TaxID=6596 RepID=UPI00234F5BA6|nr:uncharacterized protein LOC128559962 [Mercenaria mercenaria]
MATSENNKESTWSDDEFFNTLTQEGDTSTTYKDKGESTTDSEDIPLADIKQRTKRPVKRKLILRSENESEEDDSAADEDYVPSKKDINSSDSESSVLYRKVQKKKQNIKSKRETGWKRRQKKMKISKSHKVKRPDQTYLAKMLRDKIKKLQSRRKNVTALSPDVNRAKQISKRLHTIQTIVRKSHLSRLDTLLASNELRRARAYGDGNCFFNSVKISGNFDESALSLRKRVCEFMVENADKYMSFLAKKDGNSKEAFLIDINLLKTNGQWNLDIADIVPLAVANITESTVRIYSSSVSTPVIEIKPEQVTNKDICLAYLAVRGQEHYDGTKPLSNDDNDQVDFPETNRNNEVSSPPIESGYDINHDEPHSANVHTDTTPHKRALYKSPEKKHSSRKRKRNTETWKRNQRKTLKNKGQEYLSATGKRVAARKVQAHNCTKCRFKCGDKFTEEQREEIFTLYYGLGSYERQRQFICEMVERGTPSRKGKAKKTLSQKFFLAHNNRKERVCRDFFIRTLDVKRKTIDYTLARKKHGVFAEGDRRGKSSSANKLDL